MKAFARLKAELRPGVKPFRRPSGQFIGQFIGEECAIAAVEYALILPLLLLILAITVLGGQALSIKKKVVLTSGTLTDLVTQYSTISSATLTTVLDVAASTMAPYATANLSVVVSEVRTNGSGVGTVTWSQAAYSGTALKAGSTISLTRLLRMPNMTYLVGQVSYVYAPVNIFAPLGPVTLSNTSYLTPRLSTTVTLTP